MKMIIAGAALVFGLLGCVLPEGELGGSEKNTRFTECKKDCPDEACVYACHEMVWPTNQKGLTVIK